MLVSSLCRCLRVYIVKSFFCPLHVSVLKASTVFTVKQALCPNICNVVSHINPTHRICKSRQYTHTAVVNNPTNTSYFLHKSISGFLLPGASLTCSSATSSSSSLLSNKPYFPVRSPLSNNIFCNSQQASCLAEINLFLILFNVILLSQSTQDLLFFNFLTNFVLLTYLI